MGKFLITKYELQTEFRTGYYVLYKIIFGFKFKIKKGHLVNEIRDSTLFGYTVLNEYVGVRHCEKILHLLVKNLPNFKFKPI